MNLFQGLIKRHSNQLVLILLILFGLQFSANAAVSEDTECFNSEADNIVRAIAQQTDGKVLIGGSFRTNNGVTRNRIARLNSDGSLDTSFLQLSPVRIVKLPISKENYK